MKSNFIKLLFLTLIAIFTTSCLSHTVCEQSNHFNDVSRYDDGSFNYTDTNYDYKCTYEEDKDFKPYSNPLK